MNLRTIKGINFGSLVVAGFIAGYIMYFVDHWFAGTLGLFGSFPGTSNPWWMLEHHIDSIIFALLFAWPFVYGILPGRGWIKGIIFGVIWTIALTIVSTIAGALGAKIFGQMSFSVSTAVTNLLNHVIWGFFLGVLYVPTEEKMVGQPT